MGINFSQPVRILHIKGADTAYVSVATAPTGAIVRPSHGDISISELTVLLATAFNAIVCIKRNNSIIRRICQTIIQTNK